MRQAIVLACLTSVTARAASFHEDFASDPVAHGWQVFGEGYLFRGDTDSGALAVTWDSAKPNSYFHRPLGYTLSKADDFTLAFELRLDDVAVGVNPARPYTFQLAVALLNITQATRPDFHRGTGADSPNLIDLAWFPDSGFGATVSPSLISTNHQWATSFTFPVDLAIGVTHRFELAYTAADQTLRTRFLQDGQPGPAIKDTRLPANFSDFAVDTLAIASYSDAGADGSLLAHGWIDNIALTLPDPPVGEITFVGTPLVRQVKFLSATGWNYTLESTGDFQSWGDAATPVPGTGGELILTDQQEALFPLHFYRVRAERR